MNKLYCDECGTIVRSGEKYRSGEKCPKCGKHLCIHIKGDRYLRSELPTETAKIPRCIRQTMKDGSPKNKSLINGAKATSTGDKLIFTMVPE